MWCDEYPGILFPGFFLPLHSMALIKISGLISSIQGKVAGSVFQRSNSGVTLRNKVTPVNRNTNRQNKTKGYTFQILQEWIKLTDTQRSLWSAYLNYNPVTQKRTGELFVNNQQVFVKFNSYRLEYDLAILPVPGFNKCAITPIVLTLSTTGAVLTITADRAPVPAEEFIILFLTVTRRPTINNPGSTHKIIKFTTTASLSYDITTAYSTIFGAIPQIGDTIFMKYTNASKESGLPFPFKFEKVLL